MVASCPYCSAALAKMPSRKSNCPKCGLTIFVKSTPDDRTRRLMTKDQADEAERAWALRSALIQGNNTLESIGAGHRADELRAGTDAPEVEQRLLGIVAEVAAGETDFHKQKMAHSQLAVMLAKRGDRGFFNHLCQAAHCELDRIASTRLGVNLVDIRPGGDAPQCLAMVRRSVPLHEARRDMPIPNPHCPRPMGEIQQGFCTCYYLVAEEWFARR